MSIELIGLDNIPLVEPNDDICQIIKDAIEKQGCLLKHGDIILIHICHGKILILKRGIHL